MANPQTQRERLLAVMDAKNHWAWPSFTAGQVPLPQLLPHFQQEWEVYVRDFPVLLARVLGHGPPEPVRRALASNLFEEQTGGLSGARPHPELFLQMMQGCGFTPAQFESVRLLPRAQAYRSFLDQVSWQAPWVRGAAVLTIFVEGSVHERQALAAPEPSAPPSPAEIEAKVQNHPLVRFHQVPAAAMELVRVHQRVEGGHREDAWHSVLQHTLPEQEEQVASAVEQALTLWLAYRDEVAEACGLVRSPS